MSVPWPKWLLIPAMFTSKLSYLFLCLNQDNNVIHMLSYYTN